MAKVRIEYDCPVCSARAIHSEMGETSGINKEEFLRFVAYEVVCPNPKCPSAGSPQNVKVTRFVPA